MAEHLGGTLASSQQRLALRSPSSKTDSLADSAYQYKPLEPSEVRMLILLPGAFESNLQGYIAHERFDPYPSGRKEFSYEALSYVWGSQSDLKPFSVLQCSSKSSSAEVKTLQIGQNLESALRHLRRPFKTRTIWCDAICINQNNVDERGSQVQRMGHIYRHANRVAVWLGPETDNMYRATQIMKLLGSVFYFDFDAMGYDQYTATTGIFKSDLSPLPFSHADWLSLYDFFDLPWFKRLWVRQEVILAKGSAFFMVGTQELDWDDFCGASHYLMVTGLPRSKSLTERERQEFTELLKKAYHLYSYGEKRHINVTLGLVNDGKCLDPRDKIYGILGLHNEDLQIEPNYEKDYRDVYTDFARECMRSGQSQGFFPLCDTVDDNTWMHPSWVPDFAKQLPRSWYWLIGNAGAHAQPQHQILRDDSCKVLGIHCGTISQCSSLIPNKSLPSDCLAIIKSWILEASSNRTEAPSQAWIDELVSTITCGNLEDHTTDNDWTLSEVTDMLFCDMEWYSSQAPRNEREEMLFTSPLAEHAVCGNLLATTAEGKFALSIGTTQPGDEIYVMLGVHIPIILRSVGDGRHRVVGSCFMHSLMCSEALLGQLPAGWMMKFDSDGRTKAEFTDPDGQTQFEDPRLGELPPGWEQSQSEIYSPTYREGPDHSWSQYDPRLTPDRLAARGVKLKELLII